MTTPYRVQFLDASSTVIREYHADARSVAAAMGLMEGLPWPRTQSGCASSTPTGARYTPCPAPPEKPEGTVLTNNRPSRRPTMLVRLRRWFVFTLSTLPRPKFYIGMRVDRGCRLSRQSGHA